MTTRPAGNSAAAGLRRLRLYAGDPMRCLRRGLRQDVIAEALRRAEEGAISVAAALRESGLRPGPLTQIERLADELTAEELEQAIAHLRLRLALLERDINSPGPAGGDRHPSTRGSTHG